MNYDLLRNKRIALLLSGGVDSAVVLHELCSNGLHPDCFYIKIGPEEDEEWDCSSEEDMEMATALAARYSCRLRLVGLFYMAAHVREDEFKAASERLDAELASSNPAISPT